MITLTRRIKRTLVLAAVLAAMFTHVILPDTTDQLSATPSIEVAGLIGSDGDGGGC